jgi:hypothetical protein
VSFVSVMGESRQERVFEGVVLGFPPPLSLSLDDEACQDRA